MTIQDRIKKVRTSAGLTQEQFAASIGLKRNNYAQMESGNQLPPLEVISKIVRIYNTPYEWLLEGKGPSLNLTPAETGKRGKVTGKNTGKIGVQEPPEKYVSTLPVIEHVVDTSGLRLVPVVDIRAAAGSGYLNTENFDEAQVIRLPATMVKSGQHLCIRVKGPSMAPTFQDGGYLIIRLLDRSEWLNMRNEYCYVVVDHEGKTYIKRIKNRFSGIDGGFIVCTSDNPDKMSHPNFNLHPDEILYLWEVVIYFTHKMPNIHDQYYNRLSRLEDNFDQLNEQLKALQKKVELK